MLALGDKGVEAVVEDWWRCSVSSDVCADMQSREIAVLVKRLTQHIPMPAPVPWPLRVSPRLHWLRHLLSRRHPF